MFLSPSSKVNRHTAESEIIAQEREKNAQCYYFASVLIHHEVVEWG